MGNRKINSQSTASQLLINIQSIVE